MIEPRSFVVAYAINVNFQNNARDAAKKHRSNICNKFKSTTKTMTAAATKIKHNEQKAADDLYFMASGETKELRKLKKKNH